MHDEQSSPNSFWEMVRWDGCLPPVAIGSRAALALVISDVAALAIVVLFVTPMVALIRTSFANVQIKRLGIERAYGRQICLAGAIVALMVCEIVSVFVLTDTTAPLAVWL